MPFYIFHKPKPKQFNYIPRFYDPNKEALEKKKAAMGYDSELSDQEKLRMRMRSRWGYNPDEEKQAKMKVGFKGMRFVVFFGVLAVLTYIIFGTPLIDNFLTMFLHLGGK